MKDDVVSTSGSGGTPSVDLSLRRRRRLLVVVPSIGVLVAVLLAVAVTGSAGGGLYTLYGLPDPGGFTRLGLPTARVLAQVFALVCVGSLIFAAFGVRPQESGILAPDGYAALRTAAWSGFAWASCAASMVVFTAADATGQPAGEMIDLVALAQAVDLVEQAGAWLTVAGIALVVATGCRVSLRWASAVPLLVLSLIGLLPVALTGHSAGGGAHDVATSSMLFHVVAAALWVGGLVGLVAHVVRRGRAVEPLVRRYSTLALACWIAMAVSGVVNALVRLSPAELLGSTYGLLLLGKVAALIVLGVAGHAQRRRAVASIATTTGKETLIRLGAVETLVMLSTIGISVGLGRTPPPATATPQLTETELLIGYTLDGPLSTLGLLTEWRFDLVFGTAAIAAALLYARGVAVAPTRGTTWPVWRTAAWMAGCVVVLLVTSSGLGRYMPATSSASLTGHALLAVVAGVLLASGRPGLLATSAVPDTGELVGTREHLPLLGRLPAVRLFRRPAPAMVLFTAAFYGLYFGGPVDALVGEHWAHLMMNALFLGSGFIFFSAVLTPSTQTESATRTVLVLATLLYAAFCVLVRSSASVIGENFYRSLDLPWVTDLLSDQRHGAELALILGGIPLVAVTVWRFARRNRAPRTAFADGHRELATSG